jgi:hypothetical protein
MAGSVFATAETPEGRFSDLHRTNGMHFSEAHETENSTVSAGSDRTAKCCSFPLAITADQNRSGGPSEIQGVLRFLV